MAEEPTLPRLPSISWDAERQTFNNTRKRVHRGSTAALFSNFSDPAMFSSDDDPHLDNYAQGRHRKKRYVGSWYQQQPASSDSSMAEQSRPLPRGKRNFERQFDSGVWMGSDGSTDIDNDSILELSHHAQSKLQLLGSQRPVIGLSEAEQVARKVVHHAVENGKENIELMGLGLEELSDATIEPLSGFSCIPTVTKGVPFEPKEPSLRLFLGNNPLRRAPGAIFNAELLTVLSLRNTDITELPPSIGRLKNLESLNVAFTRLGYLPSELLNLVKFGGKLKELHCKPNPLYRPARLELIERPELNECRPQAESEDLAGARESAELQREEVKLDFELRELSLDAATTADNDLDNSMKESPRWYVTLLARSSVQLGDSRGVVISKFRLPELPSAGDEEGDATTVENEPLLLDPARTIGSGCPPAKASRVPSLLELSLQACSRTSALPSLASLLPPDAPSHLPGLLHRVVDQTKANGGSGSFACSTCGKLSVVPLAQWVEWWLLKSIGSHQEQEDDNITGLTVRVAEVNEATPFLNQACSWACLPKPMAFRSQLPGALHWNVKYSV